jgi:hypothetical protein
MSAQRFGVVLTSGDGSIARSPGAGAAPDVGKGLVEAQSGGHSAVLGDLPTRGRRSLVRKRSDQMVRRGIRISAESAGRLNDLRAAVACSG